MDSTDTQAGFIENGWSIYLISILILIVLFFIQRYAYLFDRKLNQLTKNESNWEGKPWPLIAGIFLGIFTLLYNVFSPADMQLNPANWLWPEWALLICGLILLGFLVFESISHFGVRTGLIRFLVLGLFAVGFFYAGLLAGLLIVSVLSLIVIIYFLVRWSKIMKIK
jgi:hypothetical protein